MPYDHEGIGYQDTDTSYAARPNDIARRRRQVLDGLSALRDATCDELAHALGITTLSVRPRLTELRDDGLIEDTGHRRALDSGKNGIVWQVKPAQLRLFPDLSSLPF